MSIWSLLPLPHQIVTVGIRAADVAELESIATQPAQDNSFFISEYDQIADPNYIDAIRRSLPARECFVVVLLTVIFGSIPNIINWLL